MEQWSYFRRNSLFLLQIRLCLTEWNRGLEFFKMGASKELLFWKSVVDTVFGIYAITNSFVPSPQIVSLNSFWKIKWGTCSPPVVFIQQPYTWNFFDPPQLSISSQTLDISKKTTKFCLTGLFSILSPEIKEGTWKLQL